jgi:hypothetical protein
MDYLNVNDTFHSFGVSVFDTTSEKYTYQFFNNTYQIADTIYMITFDGNEVLALFNHKKDVLLRKNLISNQNSKIDKLRQEKLTDKLEAIIQTYNNGMNNNTLTK